MKDYKKFYEEYLRYMKWDLALAKKEIAKFNAQELNELEAYIIQYFNSYKYVTAAVKGRIVELLTEVLPKDMSIRIWANVNSKYEFKDRIANYLEIIGREDVLDMLDNNLKTGKATYNLYKGKPGNTLSKLNDFLKSLLFNKSKNEKQVEALADYLRRAPLSTLQKFAKEVENLDPSIKVEVSKTPEGESEITITHKNA